MSPSQYPHRTGNYQAFEIHTKAFNCRSACRGHCLDPASAVEPGEVLTPHLGSRIEQRDPGACFGVECFGRIALRKIAGRTRQCEIVRMVTASWNNVIDMHWLTDHPLTGIAVLTAMVCPLVDQTNRCSPGKFLSHGPGLPGERDSRARLAGQALYLYAA